MTGDVGEMWNAHKEAGKERKARNLERAEKQQWLVKWTEHSPWHWSCKLAGKRLDYWPSRNKWQYDGRIMTGNILGFINKRITAGERK